MPIDLSGGYWWLCKRDGENERWHVTKPPSEVYDKADWRWRYSRSRDIADRGAESCNNDLRRHGRLSE